MTFLSTQNKCSETAVQHLDSQGSRLCEINHTPSSERRGTKHITQGCPDEATAHNSTGYSLHPLIPSKPTKILSHLLPTSNSQKQMLQHLTQKNASVVLPPSHPGSAVLCAVLPTTPQETLSHSTMLHNELNSICVEKKPPSSQSKDSPFLRYLCTHIPPRLQLRKHCTHSTIRKAVSHLAGPHFIGSCLMDNACS